MPRTRHRTIKRTSRIDHALAACHLMRLVLSELWNYIYGIQGINVWEGVMVVVGVMVAVGVMVVVGVMVAVGVMVVIRGNGGGNAFYFSIIFRVVPILTSGMGFAST